MKIAIVLLLVAVCCLTASDARRQRNKPKVKVEYEDLDMLYFYQDFIKALKKSGWSIFNSIRYTVASVRRTTDVICASQEKILDCFNNKPANEAQLCAREEMRKAIHEFEGIKARGLPNFRLMIAK